MDKEDSAKVVSDISSLQQDMAKVSVLVDRLNFTLEKLAEVSSSVSRLLAVHANKLEQQDKLSMQLATQFEKRTDQMEKSIHVLADKLISYEKELRREINHSNTKLVDELKSMHQEQITHYNNIAKRVSYLERWMWLITGGSIAAGFLLAQSIDIIKGFFS